MSEIRELGVIIYVKECPLQVECQKNNPQADVSMYLPTCRDCDHYWGECIDYDAPEDMIVYCIYPEIASDNLRRDKS